MLVVELCKFLSSVELFLIRSYAGIVSCAVRNLRVWVLVFLFVWKWTEAEGLWFLSLQFTWNSVRILLTPQPSSLSVCSGRALKVFLRLCGWKNDTRLSERGELPPGRGWSRRLK